MDRSGALADPQRLSDRREHARVYDFRDNLASCLAQQKKWEDAIPILIDVIADRKRTLGEDNRWTLNSQATLALIRKHDLPVKVLLGMWLEAEFSNHEGCPWLDEPIPDEELAENAVKNVAELERGRRAVPHDLGDAFVGSFNEGQLLLKGDLQGRG